MHLPLTPGESTYGAYWTEGCASKSPCERDGEGTNSHPRLECKLLIYLTI